MTIFYRRDARQTARVTDVLRDVVRESARQIIVTNSMVKFKTDYQTWYCPDDIRFKLNFNVEKTKASEKMSSMQTSPGLLFRVFLTSTLFLLFLMIIQPGSASVFLLNGSEVPKDRIVDTIKEAGRDHSGSPFPVQFFYSYQCRSCQDAWEYVQALQKKNPEIQIEYHELAYTKGSQALFTRYKDRFHTPGLSYPALFIGDIGISGSSDITYYSEPLARAYLRKGANNPVQ